MRACDSFEGQAEHTPGYDCIVKGGGSLQVKENKVKREDENKGEPRKCWLSGAFMMDKWEIYKHSILPVYLEHYLEINMRCHMLIWFLSGPQHGENQHIRDLIKLMLTVLYAGEVSKQLRDKSQFISHVPRTDSILINIIHYSLIWDFIEIRYSRNVSSAPSLR